MTNHYRKDFPTILIVDDEEDTLAILSSTLSDDFEIIEATDGQEAINLYKKYHPDIVLMDIVMEGVDGIEATKEIMKYDRNAQIIGMTGWRNRDKKFILEAGAKVLFDKPFKHEQLLKEIEMLIGDVKKSTEEQQRLYQLERGFATLQNQITDIKADIEDMRIQNEGAIKKLFNSGKKLGYSGLLGYNIISLIIAIIQYFHTNLPTFLDFIVNSPVLAIVLGVGLFMGSIVIIKYLINKIFRLEERKAKKDSRYLWIYNGVFKRTHFNRKRSIRYLFKSKKDGNNNHRHNHTKNRKKLL